MSDSTVAGVKTEDLPAWRPRPDLNVEDLAYTLEHIRRVAYMHWLGNAFDPEHMLSICNAAAQALCGEPIEAPTDLNSPQWRAHVRERTDAWMALCDDGLEGLAAAGVPDTAADVGAGS